MNKINLYTILLLLLWQGNSFAQQADIIWGDKIKSEKWMNIIGGNKTNYYTSYIKKKQLIFRKYNQSMKLEKEQTIPFELDEKQYSYKKTIFLKDKIVHLIREFKKKENKNFLYASITDFNLNVKGKTLILDEGMASTSSGGIFSDKNYGYFGANSISPDSSKLLIYKEIPSKNKEPMKMGFKVYDTDLTTLLFNKDVEFPIKNKNFRINEAEIDNYGNIYVLALIVKESKEIKKGEDDTYYKLIVFEKGTGKPKEFDFDFQQEAIMSMEIEPSMNNTIVCTGFLSNLEKGIFSKGYSDVSDEFFITNIDCSNFSILSKIRTKVTDLYPERKKASDYVPYRIRDVYSKPDGGYVVVAEQYKLEVFTTVNRGVRSTHYLYFYCDIACMNIDATGQLKSIAKIPKYQLDAYNPSINSTYHNGNVYIIYEDLTKNVQANNDKEIKKSSGYSRKKNGLFLATISLDGQVKKDLIYDYKTTNIQPYIQYSKKVSSNIILLNAKDQIGKIEFK